MSKTIWKFVLNTGTPVFMLSLPMDAKVLKVNNCWMWIEGSFGYEAKKPVQFVIIGTGHDVPNGHSYAGTYFEDEFVWHVYYMVKYD